jgi:hypothetical protein
MCRRPVTRGEHYEALLRAAHRHPALATGNLALVRYRSFWIEAPGVSASAPANLSNDRDFLRKAFEDARAAILRQIGGPETGLSEFIRSKGGLEHVDPAEGESDYEYFSLPIKLGSAILRLTVTRHDERISTSEVVDLVPPDGHMPYAEPLADSARQLTSSPHSAIGEIHAILNKLPLRPWTEGSDRVNGDEANRLVDRSRWLQQTFWEQSPIPFLADVPERAGLELRLAVDIRGIVLPADLAELTQERASTQADHSLLLGAAGVAPITDAQATVRSYWEFIKAWEIARTGPSPTPKGPQRGSMRQLPLADRDMVICTALRKRAIYASSLGFSQAPEGTKPGFISYMCIASTRNRRQLGRLVDRVSGMGVLRMLAIRDLPRLRKASQNVRDLGPKLTEIETRINAAVPTETDVGSRAGRREALAGTEQELKDFGLRLSAIGGDIRGGLAYRVARARLYAESYDNILDGMEIGRIEGFMPYDEFIRRRVREHFSFIARLGERHRQLMDRYRTALELSQSISLRDIASETNRLALTGHAIEGFVVTYYGTLFVLMFVEALLKAFSASDWLTYTKPFCALGVLVAWLLFRRKLWDFAYFLARVHR